ncbi:MAG: Hsp33 family molecular chaperone HslO [Bradymonadaceae bacterium]
MPNGALHQGVVSTDEPLGISGALTGYLLNSEQVHSVLAVGALFDEHGIRAAGGYIVQLLPGADIEVLRWITEHLEALPPVATLLERTDADPEVMSLEVFGALPHRILSRDDVHFGCDCSEDRILTALATLGEDDLEELLEDEVLEVGCDYCGKTYQIESGRLS